jgi:hypothetical protein
MTEEGKDLMHTVSGGGGAMMVANLEQQVNTIQLAMKNLMKDGVHYGKIPGCGDKPALLKAGAEKIMFMFRFAPKFDVKIDHLEGDHREVAVVTNVYDDVGNFLGQGVGSCSTKETKYRWRNAGKPCPECGFIGAIFRGKDEFGGGYYCNANKGGCSKSFKKQTDGCKAIDAMTTGKVENPDIADQYNTVLKMAKKRSVVDATLTVTAASDVFEQDLDEFSEEELEAIRAGKNAERGKPRTDQPKKKEAPKPKPKPVSKKAQEPTPESSDEQAGDDEPTFTLDDYKQMSGENSANIRDWWVGICTQAMTDLGLKKYDLFEKYLEGVHKLNLDDEE